ncbi:hypothetical protein T492DRAFT_1149845 [Pavlovales sp. CCMP2436]|nr:hypothetical protein T492DRAFT_1149845 [Pavlovales sp. CCMP2436]
MNGLLLLAMFGVLTPARQCAPDSESPLPAWLGSLHFFVPSQHFSVLDGAFNVSLAAIRCSNISISTLASARLDGPERLQLNASGLTIACAANWSYVATNPLRVPAASGSVTVDTAGSSAALALALSTDAHLGLPNGARALGCTAAIVIRDVSFSGSIVAALLKVLEALFRYTLERLIAAQLCSAVRTAIDANLTSALRELDTELAPFRPGAPPRPPPPPPPPAALVWREVAAVSAAAGLVDELVGGRESAFSPGEAARALSAQDDGSFTLLPRGSAGLSLSWNLPGLANISLSLLALNVSGLDSLRTLTVGPLTAAASAATATTNDGSDAASTAAAGTSTIGTDAGGMSSGTSSSDGSGSRSRSRSGRGGGSGADGAALSVSMEAERLTLSAWLVVSVTPLAGGALNGTRLCESVRISLSLANLTAALAVDLPVLRPLLVNLTAEQLAANDGVARAALCALGAIDTPALRVRSLKLTLGAVQGIELSTTLGALESQVDAALSATLELALRASPALPSIIAGLADGPGVEKLGEALRAGVRAALLAGPVCEAAVPPPPPPPPSLNMFDLVAWPSAPFDWLAHVSDLDELASEGVLAATSGSGTFSWRGQAAPLLISRTLPGHAHVLSLWLTAASASGLESAQNLKAPTLDPKQAQSMRAGGGLRWLNASVELAVWVGPPPAAEEVGDGLGEMGDKGVGVAADPIRVSDGHHHVPADAMRLRVGLSLDSLRAGVSMLVGLNQSLAGASARGCGCACACSAPLAPLPFLSPLPRPKLQPLQRPERLGREGGSKGKGSKGRGSKGRGSKGRGGGGR